MLVYLQGEDSYLAKKAIDQLKGKYRAKNPTMLELVEIDGSDERLPNWADLQAVPLFASSRLVIVKRAALLPVNKQEGLAYFLQDLPTTTVVVIWDGRELPAKSPLGSPLSQANKVIAVGSLPIAQVKSWLKAQAKALDLTLLPEQMDELVERLGNDLWALSSELTQLKLGTASNSYRKVSQSEPFVYFKLIRQGSWDKVKEQLRLDYELGTPIELVIGSLAGAIRKLDSISQRQSLTELLMDIDVGRKTGWLDDASAIALLIGYLPSAPASRARWEELHRVR